MQASDQESNPHGSNKFVRLTDEQVDLIPTEVLEQIAERYGI